MRIWLSILFLAFVITATAQEALPTISFSSVNGSSALTSPTFYGYTNSNFSYYGAPKVVATNYAGINGFFEGQCTAPQGTCMPAKLQFDINCQDFEFQIIGAYPMVQVYTRSSLGTNYTTFTNWVSNMALGQGYVWVHVHYASKASRSVVCLASMEQGAAISGLNVQSGDSWAASTLPAVKKVEWLGASYSEGYTANVSSGPPPLYDYRWLGGYNQWIESFWFSNGIPAAVIPDGEGGTGYQEANTGAEQTFQGRFLTDVVSNHPDYLILGGDGPMNDYFNGGVSQASEVIAVSNLLTLATNYFTPKQIIVMGASYYATSNSWVAPTTAYTNYDLAIGQVATNFGCFFYDELTKGVLNANNCIYFEGPAIVHPMPFVGQGYWIKATNMIPTINADFGFGSSTLNGTNFGMVGDWTNALVNCTSNSQTVTFQFNVPSRYLGESIIVDNAGSAQYGTLSGGSSGVGWQDQVGTITNISGSTVTMNIVASNTLTGTYCEIFTNNQVAFQNAINACGIGTNLYIPGMPNSISGVYGMLPIATSAGNYGYWCCSITNAGFMVYGDGTNIRSATGPALCEGGAWRYEPYAYGGDGLGPLAPQRGQLLNEYPPNLNPNLSLTFSNLTLDGGVQSGYQSVGNHAGGINIYDGGQWDESHHAFQTWESGSPDLTNLTFVSCLIQHWRGEEIISTGQPVVGGTITCLNDTFYDGNGSAWNYYTEGTYSNCVVSTVYLWFEFFAQSMDGAPYVVNCTVTNVAGNLATFDGGYPYCPTSIVSGCTIWPWGTGGVQYDGFQMLPGDDVILRSNNVTFPNNSAAYFAGLPGAGAENLPDTTYPSSNILVYANSLTNCYSIWQGATVPNNYAYTISHVNLDSNVVVSAGSGQSYVWLINSYGGLTTNFEASGNVFPSGTPVQTTSGGGYENDFSPLAYIGVNNNFTNTISVTGSVSPMLYSNGPNMLITSTIGAGKLLLDTNYPNYMPTNAQVKVNNASANSAVLPVLLGGVNGTYNQPANSVQIYNYSRSGNDYSTNAAGTNPPTATFTGSPLTGLAPLSVTFTYTGTGTGSDIYAWTFGDGGTSTAQNPSHTYTSAGTYTVSLQVDAQTQNTSNNYITATNLPTATFTGTPTSGAITLSVAFTYTGTGASTWGWTFGDGGTSTSQNPNHSYTAASTYTVSLIVNNEVTNTQNNYITATNPSSAPPNYAAPLWFH